MSGYTSAWLTCNGRDRGPDPKVPDTPCPAKFEDGEQPDGSWAFPRTVAEARRLAKANGWLFVQHPRLKSLLSADFCPAHEDQARALAVEYGVKIARPKPKQED